MKYIKSPTAVTDPVVIPGFGVIADGQEIEGDGLDRFVPQLLSPVTPPPVKKVILMPSEPAAASASVDGAPDVDVSEAMDGTDTADDSSDAGTTPKKGKKGKKS